MTNVTNELANNLKNMSKLRFNQPPSNVNYFPFRAGLKEISRTSQNKHLRGKTQH